MNVEVSDLSEQAVQGALLPAFPDEDMNGGVSCNRKASQGF